MHLDIFSPLLDSYSAANDDWRECREKRALNKRAGQFAKNGDNIFPCQGTKQTSRPYCERVELKVSSVGVKRKSLLTFFKEFALTNVD